MKNNYFVFGFVAIMVLILILFTIQSQEQLNNEFSETIPVIDAYYNGEKLWFIHTDVTDSKMAERLTKMVNYQTLYVPNHQNIVDVDKLAKLYVFTNGIDQKSVKPWGGGPFGFQIDIFDSIPGDQNYTALRTPKLVTWEDGINPRIIKSEEELLEAELNGELIIKKTNVVVNVPVVRWPSSYLGGTTKIN